MPDALENRLASEWREMMRSIRTASVATIVERSSPDLASQTAVLAELEDTRILMRELRTSIEAHADERVRVTRHWTIRDVVAHLASWARETRHEIEVVRSRRPFDYTIHFEREGGPREWNQREINTRDDRSVAELFEEFDLETARLGDLVSSLSKDEMRAEMELPRTSGEPPVAWRLGLAPLLVRTCWHVRYHLKAIQRARLGDT